MAGLPRPKPCYLDNFEFWRVIDRQKVWRNSKDNRLYTWDSRHGEIEVFNTRGHHLGVVHAVTGLFIKPAVKGRKIDVK